MLVFFLTFFFSSDFFSNIHHYRKKKKHKKNLPPRTQCADALALPPRSVRLRRDALDDRERDFYEALYTQSQAQFGEYVAAGTVLNNYAHVFDLLVRLRQAVNHPYLVVHSRATRDAAARRAAIEGGGGGASSSSVAAAAASSRSSSPPPENVECPVCHDACDDPVVSSACGHAACRECAREWAAAAAASVEGGGGGGCGGGNGNGNGRRGGSSSAAPALRCPAEGCNAPWSVDLSSRGTTPEAEEEEQGKAVPSPSNALPFPPSRSAAAMLPSFGVTPARRDSILHSIEASSFATSTKLEALREEVERARLEDPGAKVLAFSQFTSMLDLAAFRLGQVGIRSVRLEGGMSMEARARAISTFTGDPDVPVFLMSLKAGGVALNLTVASRCVVLDLFWNPAVEQQAQDRIHRLGQHRNVSSVRLCVAGSVEERILKLQEKKQAIFEGTIGADDAALAKLTVDDLRFLFG